ncbi:DUF86 domain-containing protein [Cytobacillus gottheilii]|uniref:DUF86 domain-containing protein n=1 Tax=Cytobacillus gottheilii TaxID=859144 RepID=UPI0009BABEFC|nr:DUF86 domain-containing protein [Cytobacillus gottheilii]
MYFVDRNKMEETLQHFHSQLALFKQQSDWTTPIEKSALERVTHILIEAILDTGNAMIDGFIMRDPGSYDDIIDILEDEKVIENTMSSGMKELISCRKMLVQDYIHIDHQQLQAIFQKNIHILEMFPAKIRDYLTNELGPVSAFKE